MTTRREIRIIVDFIMTVLMLVLMSYSLIGEAVHEWVGASMFALLLGHHGLNWRWLKNLFQGRYTAVRIIRTGVDAVILLLMIALMASGIAMSRYVFSFLPTFGGTSLARMVHLVASYWCYVFISVHLGLHGNMMIGMFRKKDSIPKSSAMEKRVLQIVAVAFVFYGVYAFIKRGFMGYLTWQTRFAFYDFSEPLMFFIVDYAAVMLMFSILGYYLSKWVSKAGKRRKQR